VSRCVEAIFYNLIVPILSDYQWYETTFNVPLPTTAIIGGHEDDGTIIYVGRIQHGGELLPAKIIPSQKVACAPLDGKEIFKDEFEVRVIND
jgi:hypothetical protein